MRGVLIVFVHVSAGNNGTLLELARQALENLALRVIVDFRIYQLVQGRVQLTRNVGE